MTTPEEYLSPKQLPDALRARFGLSISYRDVRQIRIRSLRLKDGLFLAGDARPSEVIEWLKAHQEFNVRSSPKRTTQLIV